MIKRYPGWNWSSIFARTFATGGAITLTGCLAIAFSSSRALAQNLPIVPDNTLVADPSRVTHTTIKGLPSDQIDGGVIRGTNLFHSFLEFNINEGRGVYFTNPAGIENILTRVIGSKPSKIFGTLGVLGNANLFLLNPNGILFGGNAQLDLQGSFVATTASGIRFSNGGEFTITSGDVPTNGLLTVNPSALLFNQIPGPINVVNQANLQVKPTQNLFLVGGDVILQGGKLTAPGGRVELGGLAAAGEIKIEDFPNVGLTFPDGVARANVSLTNNSVVDVRAGGGGYIAIRARDITVSGGSSILAGIASGQGSSSARAGNILLDSTGKVSASEGSRIANEVSASATSDSTNIFDAIKNNIIYGSVGIKAESLELTSGAQISTSTFGKGSAGLLLVQAEGQVSVDGGLFGGNTAAIFSNVEGGAIGDAGGILIEAGSLSLANGGQLQTLVRGSDQAPVAGRGIAGAVLVEARDTVTISGRNTQNFPSATFSTLQKGATGEAGLVSISAGSVQIKDGAAVTTSTLGTGDAGIVLIEAKGDVSVTGNGTLISSNVEQRATGNTVGVRIDARSLFMSGGAKVQALTRGNGSAGKILINASDLVDLTGVNPEGSSTGLFTSTEGDGTGDGGLIEVNAGTLQLSDAAVLSARTQTPGAGGGILVNVDTLKLLDGGQILATAFSSGAAGGILINAKDKIVISGSDPTFYDRALQLYNDYVYQYGEDKALKLFLQTFDNIPPGSSGIFANVIFDSTADAGGILITTKDMFIRDGGTISIDNPGPGEAGAIGIIGRDLIMKNQATINARAISGKGGDILLFPNTFLLLLENSTISTSSGFDGQPGSGGNVTIGTRYIIGAPFNNNDIRANAYGKGEGGHISFNANRLYDIQEQEPPTFSTNDITASSGFGLNGTVSATVLNIDPTQGLSNLPAEAVDPTRLIAETCAPRGGITERQKNQFIVTNRGGLPPDPNAAFPGEAVVTDQGTPNQQNNQPNSPHSTNNPASSPPVATASPQQPENQPDNPGSSNSTSATPTATASTQSPENQPDNPGSTNSTGATPTATASTQSPENQPDNPGSTNSTGATPTATASPQPPIVEAQGWVYEKNGDIKFTNESPIGTPTHSQLIPASTCNGLSTQP